MDQFWCKNLDRQKSSETMEKYFLEIGSINSSIDEFYQGVNVRVRLCFIGCPILVTVNDIKGQL